MAETLGKLEKEMERESGFAADPDSWSQLAVLRAVWRAKAQTNILEIEGLADRLEIEALAEEDAQESDEIDRLYMSIRELLSNPPTATTEAKYGALLRRLRQLQETEAEAMNAEFQRRSGLPEGLAERVVDDAKKLLKSTRSR